MWNFYLFASFGMLIEQFDDMHGATIRVKICLLFCETLLGRTASNDFLFKVQFM